MEYFIPSPKKGSESKAKVISRRAFALTSFKFDFLATDCVPSILSSDY